MCMSTALLPILPPFLPSPTSLPAQRRAGDDIIQQRDMSKQQILQQLLWVVDSFHTQPCPEDCFRSCAPRAVDDGADGGGGAQ